MKAYTMKDLEQRQTEEGFQFGYLGHSVRGNDGGTCRDRIVLKFLKAHGFDRDDAYQALNSRAGRHLGDSLSGSFTEAELADVVAKSLWNTPEAMYADFKQTKEELSYRARTRTRQLNETFAQIAQAGAALLEPGEDGLHDPLTPSSKGCVYGPDGSFPKKGRCTGIVTTEGNRMPVCSFHRLMSSLEIADHLANKLAELQQSIAKQQVRIRTLTDKLAKEAR